MIFFDQLVTDIHEMSFSNILDVSNDVKMFPMPVKTLGVKFSRVITTFFLYDDHLHTYDITGDNCIGIGLDNTKASIGAACVILFIISLKKRARNVFTILALISKTSLTSLQKKRKTFCAW